MDNITKVSRMVADIMVVDDITRVEVVEVEEEEDVVSNTPLLI